VGEREKEGGCVRGREGGRRGGARNRDRDRPTESMEEEEELLLLLRLEKGKVHPHTHTLQISRASREQRLNLRCLRASLAQPLNQPCTQAALGLLDHECNPADTSEDAWAETEL